MRAHPATEPHRFLYCAIAAFCLWTAGSDAVWSADRNTLTTSPVQFGSALEIASQNVARATPGDTLCHVVVLFSQNPQLETHRNAKTISLSRQRQETLSRLTSFHNADEDYAMSRILSLPGTTIGRRFWITRAAEISIPASELQKLKLIDDIDAVIVNAKLEYVVPVAENQATMSSSIGPSLPLVSMNIPALWNIGLHGNGRRVASFDTGVEGSHVALANNYNGLTASASSSFFAPNSTETFPFDNVGHGTHTMGLMVGHAGADTFGVAPGATWMSAAVIDQGQSFNGTIADILDAFQWALNPDGDFTTTNDIPDVILNSWGIPNGIFPSACDNTFWVAIDNVEAAGVVTIFAAGNEGPTPYSVRSPANRISSPMNCFSVGALGTQYDTLATFSSRGPSPCDSVTIKPEVVAPGVSIYSCTRGGGFAIRSGTSMAAPFVAGMVALLRQYNPNATVQEIKQAILGSCRDLGQPGPDNNYGSGLPDALVALQLMPRPDAPTFTLEDVHIDGDGIAAPGENVGLQIDVRATLGTVDSVSGILRSLSADAEVLPDTILFFFSGATGLGSNIRPFRINVDPSLAHGWQLSLVLEMSGFETVLDIPLTIGVPAKGDIVTHHTSDLAFSVSNFGQYGLGPQSAYYAGGEGLRFRNGPNWLYEAGLVVGRNSLQLSSGVRDSLGNSFNGDFTPLGGASTSSIPGEFICQFDDHASAIPIPITIEQRSKISDAPDANGCVIMEFVLRNNSVEPVTGLRIGWFVDCDIDPISRADQLAYDPSLGLLSFNSTVGSAGVVALTQTGCVGLGTNSSQKTTFTKAQKFALLQSTALSVEDPAARDYYAQLNFGPFNLNPGDSEVVALAVVVGASNAELTHNAIAARERYLIPTATGDDNNSTLPASFALKQNYPNPFNPSTKITFTSPRTERVTVTIYNILGQGVRTLFDGIARVGETQLEWDGLDDHGAPVASGAFYYRLTADRVSISRAMTLIK